MISINYASHWTVYPAIKMPVKDLSHWPSPPKKKKNSKYYKRALVYSDICLCVPCGSFLDKLRSAESSSLGGRRADSGASARRLGFVRPCCLRSAALFCCIHWIKWWRAASAASKKDFLSPAVVALPVEEKRTNENGGLKLGCGLSLRRRFCLCFWIMIFLQHNLWNQK